MNIIIAGDFCPNYRLLDVDLKSANMVSDSIAALLKNVDFSIVNFECPVSFPNQKPIKKQGPNLSCSSSALAYIKQIGFSGVTLANNHILDYGEDGLLCTIDAIKKEGLKYVGAGKPADPNRNVVYFESHDETVAMVNCCENEFSVTSDREIGATPINPLRQYYLIKEAKEKADYVVVVVHGGIEHFQHPTMRMKEAYRFFVDAGADAVINHHQHCFCGYEEYHNKPIFYGLGNFCFDWEGKRNTIWNEGFMVELHLNKVDVNYKLIPYIQCNEDPVVEKMTDSQLQLFYNRISELNHIIADDSKLEKILSEYMMETSEEYILSLEPYSSRIGLGLYRRGLLPSFVTSSRLLKLYDFVLCESHRERLIYLLKSKYQQLKNE